MGYLTHGATAGGKTYDLLPCPHCGGEAEFRDGSSTKPYIRCKECGCRTWGSHAYDKLVAAWNRHAERMCKSVSPYGFNDRSNAFNFKCSECGAFVDSDDMGYSPLVVDEECEPLRFCPNCGAKVVDE